VLGSSGEHARRQEVALHRSAWQQEVGILARAANRLIGQVLALSPDEASFRRRAFNAESEHARARLEAVGRTFIQGYNAALAAGETAVLEHALDAIPAIDRGFAYEGAGMALALLDLLTPWRTDRLLNLLGGPGDAHAYMVHVGAGWALARLARGERDMPHGLDPLLRWLVFDGFGFHEGYFHHAATIRAQRRPRRLAGYALRVFDQGLGRSLWFVEGADVERVAAVVAAFPLERRADLWSGVGLAATYAGAIDERELVLLRSRAGEYNPHLAQGAAFAAKARERSGSPAAHTDRACRVFCGCSAAAAALATDEALVGLRGDAELPDFEVWRRRIRNRYSSEAAIS
jgi:hypothetical protein